eukprot:13603908-Alexandrium_andersonii.AAC.1
MVGAGWQAASAPRGRRPAIAACDTAQLGRLRPSSGPRAAAPTARAAPPALPRPRTASPSAQPRSLPARPCAPVSRFAQ